MISRVLFLTLLTSSLTLSIACAPTSRRLNSLRLGLTKTQVIDRLGRPHSTSSQGNVEYLTYNFLNKGNGEIREYTVKLYAGAVEAFGERTDFAPQRLNAPATTPPSTNSPAPRTP